MKTYTSKHKRKVPFIEQMQQTECGLCCMAMIASYYKSSFSLYEMREATGNGRDGTSLKQMRELARNLGFEANWYKLQTEQLVDTEGPVILFWDNKHFVVLEKIVNKNYVIVDPDGGRKKLSRSEFDKFFTGYTLTCIPKKDFIRKKAKSVWKPFLKLLINKPKLLISVIITAILLQLFTLGVPMIIQSVIDRVIIPSRDNLLSIFLIGIVFLVLFQSGVSFIRGKLLITLNNFLDQKMMTQFFRHLLNLPYSFFQLRSFGDLIFRSNSLLNIRNLLSNQLIMGTLDVSLIIVILIYMINKSILMTAWVVLVSMLSILLVLLSKNILYQKNQDEITKATNVQSFQTELLYGIFGVKTAGTERSMYNSWEKLFNKLLLAYRKKGNVLNYINTLNGLLKMLGPLIVLWLGAQLVFSGEITLGALVAFHSLAIQFFNLTGSVIDTFNSFLVTDSYLRRVQDVLDSPQERKPKNPTILRALRGEIVLDNVYLKYAENQEYILKNINLRINPGQKVALVGKSGAGKSTLSRLILGLYEPTQGSIYYDGHNLLHLDKETFRKKIGVVPQDVSLFNRSIKENIALHQPDATMEDIIEAAKVAKIHDEIMLMPMNYNTIISELGMNISGGQRQRLAIARALVHKPSILVLDEATSSLDHVNEKEIDEYLSSINCTRIVISHRLTSLVNSDLILVLDNGEIIESGTHVDLINTGGFYAQYYQRLEHTEESVYSTT
ncbi:peptidase domain-containing ABC transporter [Bacillus paramycoides]|uniref:peptidase domain-containing ABC transporter n=1 Tax=Bacillus paramycoides TaxID=2026194 RepID=UPI003183472F